MITVNELHVFFLRCLLYRRKKCGELNRWIQIIVFKSKTLNTALVQGIHYLVI